VKLQVIDNAIELLRQLRPCVGRIRGRDKRLAAQIVDAANSTVLNLGEGEYSDPGNRRARFHTAAGSAAEVRAGVRAAVAWGYVTPEQVGPALSELDTIVAIIWKLTRG
jgi:four helix bundle protein